MKSIIGYHFTGDKLRNGDPIPPIGEWLVHDGPVVPCSSGLHCSEHPFDALQNAPGNLLHLVELNEELTPHGSPVDKWVGRRRKIIKSANVESMLRAFSRLCALEVIGLWNAPEIVIQFLQTGDESIRAAAGAAAGAAAWAAAWAAAGDAARAAAWDAARAAAGAAARDAAWAAAWAAAGEKQREQFKTMVEKEFNK